MKAVQYPNLRSYLSGALLLALCAGAGAADYQTTVLSKSPVGYWRLNETTMPPAPPIFATNSSTLGGSVNGEYLGGAVRGVTPGAVASQPANGGTYFPQQAQNRVRIPYRPEWNTSGAFTVEFWAKPGTTAGTLCPAASVEFIASPLWRNGWLFYQTGNGWSFRMYHSQGGGTLADAAISMPLSTSEFYHVVGVCDGASTLKLYTNGALARTVNVAPYIFRANTNTAIPLTFGARADGASGYFEYNGVVDEPAFYMTALSDAQILAHYMAGTNASPATPYQTLILADAPSGYWRLGEPADPGAANLGTLGAAGNGKYIYDVRPGVAGPSSPAFPGFEAANKAVANDGSDGYVSLPPLNMNTNRATILGWVNVTNPQPAAGGLILCRAGTTVAGITMDAVGPTYALGYNWNDDMAAYNWVSGVSLNDSVWAFVALIIEPTKGTLAAGTASDYNTFNSGVNPINHAPQAFAGQTLLGKDAGYTDRNMNGAIDEVAIFNRALSLGEVYSIYAASLGNVPARIFAHPVAPVDALYAGDPLTLTVDAGGSEPVTYQWRKDGGNIAGATTTSYSFNPLTAGDTGTYDCVAQNAYGSETSQGAYLMVNPQAAPVIVEQPMGRTIYAGGTLTLKVAATGGGLTYQWSKDSSPITGATNALYQVASVAAADSGSYQVTVANTLGNAIGGPVTVTVVTPAAGTYEALVLTDPPRAWWRLEETSGTIMYDAMGRHDGSYTNATGSPVTFGATGAMAGSKAVTFDGTSESYGTIPFSPLLNTADFTIECWARTANTTEARTAVSSRDGAKGAWLQAYPAGSWSGGIGDGGTLYYVPTSVAASPITANKWTHLAISYSSSTGLRVYIDGQWDGVSYVDFDRNASGPFIIGAEGVNSALSSVESLWIGQIDEVAVYTKALTPAQLEQHYVTAIYGANTAPTFTLQPVSQTVVVGTTVTLEAYAEGSIPLTVQWHKNGEAIAGATGMNLSLGAVDFGDTGDYRIEARNSAGTNFSAIATVTVMPVPAFANATNELVLHLKFDNNYQDSSGRAHNATAVGAPTFVPGKFGQGFKFSTDTTAATYNYLTLGATPPADLQFGTATDFSVAYWIRTEPGQTNGDLPIICTATNSYGNLGLTFAPSYNEGGWSYSLNGIAQTYGGANSINSGTWTHILHSFTRTGVGVTYRNGVQVDSRSIVNVGNLDRTAPFNIGQDPTGTYGETGSAEIDDLAIWRRALTPFDAYAIYYVGQNLGKGIDSYGPVTITLQYSGADMEIIWQAGTLEEASIITGPWSTVAGATAPYFKVTPAATGNKFYRVRL